MKINTQHIQFLKPFRFLMLSWIFLFVLGSQIVDEHSVLCNSEVIELVDLAQDSEEADEIERDWLSSMEETLELETLAKTSIPVLSAAHLSCDLQSIKSPPPEDC